MTSSEAPLTAQDLATVRDALFIAQGDPQISDGDRAAFASLLAKLPDA